VIVARMPQLQRMLDRCSVRAWIRVHTPISMQRMEIWLNGLLRPAPLSLMVALGYLRLLRLHSSTAMCLQTQRRTIRRHPRSRHSEMAQAMGCRLCRGHYRQAGKSQKRRKRQRARPHFVSSRIHVRVRQLMLKALLRRRQARHCQRRNQRRRARFAYIAPHGT
jgi:hypothetical protein